MSSPQALTVRINVKTIDLAPIFNNRAATQEQAGLPTGQLNVWRNSLPATGEPIAAECDGVELRSVPLDGGGTDNVVCDGQTVLVETPGRYDWLYVLCCSERRAKDSVVFYFDDSSSYEETLYVSDLWEGVPGHGEVLAHRSSVTHYPHHVQPRIGITVWTQRVPIAHRAVLTHLKLPTSRGIHLFAAALVSPWALTTSPFAAGGHGKEVEH